MRDHHIILAQVYLSDVALYVRASALTGQQVARNGVMPALDKGVTDYARKLTGDEYLHSVLP